LNLCVTADRHWAIGKDGRPLVTIPADSAKTQEGDRDSILEFYRSMIRFRQWGPWRDCREDSPLETG
jgi:hypothetical protein